MYKSNTSYQFSVRSSIEAGPTNGQEGHKNLPRSDSNKVDRTKNPDGQRESEQLVPTSGRLKEKDISDHLRCFFDKWERSRTGRCTAWGACRWGSSFSFPCFFLIPATRDQDEKPWLSSDVQERRNCPTWRQLLPCWARWFWMQVSWDGFVSFCNQQGVCVGQSCLSKEIHN